VSQQVSSFPADVKPALGNSSRAIQIGGHLRQMQKRPSQRLSIKAAKIARIACDQEATAAQFTEQRIGISFSARALDDRLDILFQTKSVGHSRSNGDDAARTDTATRI
jgi:hypothetical protein